MYAVELSPSSTAPTTTRSGSPLSSSRRSPSGAATAHTTVMSSAPRSVSRRQQCTSEPPVASIGSSTSTGRPVSDAGSDSR